jgi:alpha-tubulin suppressor-like RCC1 family protein
MTQPYPIKVKTALTKTIMMNTALRTIGVAAGSLLFFAASAPQADAQSNSATRIIVNEHVSGDRSQATVVATIDGLNGVRPVGTVNFARGISPSASPIARVTARFDPRATAIGAAQIDPLAGSTGFATIATGGSHTCIILRTTNVSCWGNNDKGQLGTAITTPKSATPLPVNDGASPMTDVVALAAGFDFTCALNVAGVVKCWGDNSIKQLGNGTKNNSSAPVQVALGTGAAIGITAGGGQACAIMRGGTVKCWGFVGFGDGVNQSRDVTDITTAPNVNLNGIVQIEAGNWHVCAVQLGGALFCWGTDSNHQFGDGATDPKATAPNLYNTTASRAALQSRPSSFRSDIIAVAAGMRQTCALTRSGAAVCFGSNKGPAGRAIAGDVPVDPQVPQPVSNAFGYGGDIDLIILADRPVSITQDTRRTSPFATDDVVIALAGGKGTIRPTTDQEGKSNNGYHMCALMSSGDVRCLGDNRQNQSVANPIVTNAVEIAAGGNHTCAVIADGSVSCWGSNANNQLGVATPTTNSAVPIKVANVAAIVRTRAMIDVTPAAAGAAAPTATFVAR